MRSGSSYRSRSSRGRRLAAFAARAFVLCVLLVPALAAARKDPRLVFRTLDIPTGDGPVVSRVVFAGNSAFEADDLFLYMRTRESSFMRKHIFDRREFREDLANVERFYQSQGFLDADVRLGDIALSADSTRVELLVDVEEGMRWRIESVSFEGEAVISEDELRAAVRLVEESPFVVGRLDRDRRAISEEYARRSYLDAQVSQDVVRDDELGTVSISYAIVEREQARIASIDVVGDEKTRQFVVERELTFSEGELFDFEKIGESQANIYRTGLFNSVWIEPDEADTGRPLKDVIVRVGERASGEFDLSVNYEGISLSEGIQGFDFLEVAAAVRSRNLQGQATAVTLGGSYSALDRDIRVSIGDPWMLGFPVAGELAASYERKDEELKDEESYMSEKSGASFVLAKKLGLKLTLEGGYEYTHGYVSGGEDGGSTETSDITLAAVFDSRNDVLSASRGMFARSEVDLASSRLGGTNDFVRYELNWRGYARPVRGRVAALELLVGWINPMGDDSEVPSTERYVPDREGLVRGFPRELREDGTPVGGMALMLARGEVRFPLRKKLRGAAFVDAGRVFENMSDVDLSSLGVGAGLGLRYETPIGVIRLDVATPVSEKGEPQYYFGIGQVF